MVRLGYLHTARLVVLGIWRISCGGSARCTGAGGAGSARFSFGDLLQEGPCSTGREPDPPEGWICRSTALGVCSLQVPWQELVPFGILAGGWAREMALASAFVPRQAELCRLGLNNSPSHCPLDLPFSEQSCYVKTFQMLSPACCQNTLRPVPLLLQARLRGSALLCRWAGPLPRLPPASPCSVHHLSTLPTLFRGPLVYAWLWKIVLLVFWQFSDRKSVV